MPLLFSCCRCGLTIPPGSPLWLEGANDAGRTRLDRIAALADSLERAGLTVRRDVVEGVPHLGYPLVPAVEAFFADRSSVRQILRTDLLSMLATAAELVAEVGRELWQTSFEAASASLAYRHTATDGWGRRAVSEVARCGGSSRIVIVIVPPNRSISPCD